MYACVCDVYSVSVCACSLHDIKWVSLGMNNIQAYLHAQCQGCMVMTDQLKKGDRTISYQWKIQSGCSSCDLIHSAWMGCKICVCTTAFCRSMCPEMCPGKTGINSDLKTKHFPQLQANTFSYKQSKQLFEKYM